MRKYKIPILLLFLFLGPGMLFAQNNSFFDKGIYIAKADTLPYRILFPKNFDPAKKYPMIFVLHGIYQRGNNNEAQLKYGTELFLKDSIRQEYAAIVVYPQCPVTGYWSNVKIVKDSVNNGYKFLFPVNASPTKTMQSLLGLVDQLLDKPYVNKRKVYIGGLSMGGMGTFEIIGRRPGIFAAAFAICGGDNTLNAKKYAKKVPIWIFHGQQDKDVPYTYSEAMVVAIKEYGGSPKYTLYPNDGHDCWNDAFAEPLLIPWLFSHSK